jgi:hypothetical protein
MNVSRRKFLAAAPIAAAAILQFKGVGFGQSVSRDRPSVIGQDALSRLTWDSFYPYITTDFTFGVGQNAVRMTLTGMTDTRPNGVRVRKGQECFVMKFQGPYYQPLTQGIYQVNHFALGDFDLFITDGGRVGKKRYYVAVINRVVL